ncbi:MAG: phosphatidylserine decarboxylase [Deltaproteobacteria bacterium]|jgi:phosphatidylserine decarboxylase|nr:phosphatidylserine decarboxylase [Deltaproteobacteria bacterium]
MSEPGKLFITGMRLLPKKPLSRAVRRLASVHSQMAVRRFAARYGAAVDEAERPLEEYGSVLEFFTRRLKPGLRPIDPDPKVLISPVDGAFLVGGPVGEGRLFQAKGRDYSVSALLADPDAEQVFKDGAYCTVYLAPKDYHRIHTPVDGVITGYTYVPGELYPVNPAAVAHVDQLFAKNERLITHVESERFGRVEIVKVGATNVGHITLTYDPAVATNLGQREIVKKRYDQPIPIKKGDEVGVFEMGSTVILVVERPVNFEAYEQGAPLRLGRALGRAS